ncbi:hypothetical protein GEMRC1_006746 [Eukaryota sp. GEM-RC1]
MNFSYSELESVYSKVNAIKSKKSVLRILLNELTGNYVALKEYKSKPNSGNIGIEREGYMLNVPSHPNIIRYYARFQDSQTNRVGFLMDFVPGGDLQNYIHGNVQPGSNLHARGRPFSGEHLWKALSQLIDSIEFLHNTLRICHRDLKSLNVLLDENADLIVMDFDHVRRMDGTVFETKSIGSPLYTAPEIATDPYYTVSAEYFSLGVLLYEIVTGSWPFLPTAAGHRNQLAELEECKINPPDYSIVPQFFSSMLKGLLDATPHTRQESYRSLLRDSTIQQIRDSFRPQRPRFVKIAPWSDCDYLIVSDKAPSELLEEVCCLSENAQVLRVNCDRLCLCAETAKSFIQHLMEFIIPGSEVNTNVSFQMVDEDLNGLLCDCWIDVM